MHNLYDSDYDGCILEHTCKAKSNDDNGPTLDIVVLERGVSRLRALEERLGERRLLLRLGVLDQHDLGIGQVERPLEVGKDLVQNLHLRERHRTVERGLCTELSHAFLQIPYLMSEQAFQTADKYQDIAP